MRSPASLSFPALALALCGSVAAAPNGPWPTNNPWATVWSEYPQSWPAPSWYKPSWQGPSATGSASAASASAPASASATTSAVSSVTASASASASATATGSTGGAAIPSAVVKNGTVAGVYSPGYNQDYFLGLPYAQPPINDLRFRVPQSLNSSFSGTYEATSYPSECIGYGSDQWPYAISEDCLYLNVIRPHNYSAYDEPLPVAVWIHGGGYAEGGSPDQRYNLSFIVQNGVQIDRPFIGISINYRLSAWGFIASDQVWGSGNTNLGLRDQRLALHWVQENIAAFGGDPKHVTIWGESAGASSVGFHLVAYNGRNDSLFSGAIMESGNSVPYSGLYGSDKWQPKYNAIVNNTGCGNAADTLECLRSLPFNTLNNAINTTNATTWFPVVDGDLIAKFPSIQLAAGDYVHVPIISGANSDEGISFGPNPAPNTTAQFVGRLENGTISPNVPLAPSIAENLATTYLNLSICDTPPGTLGCNPEPAADGALYRWTAAFAGDAVFIANRRLQCQTWANNGDTAYCYRFNIQPNGNSVDAGVPHFQEVAFVFDNINGIGYSAAPDPFGGEPASYDAAAKLMSCSWASFINSGDPNGWLGRDSSTPEWPAYSTSNPENIVWDANVTALAYTEPDTFRAAGIALINQYNLAFQR